MTSDPKGPSTDDKRFRAATDSPSTPGGGGERPSGRRDMLGLALLVASAFCGVAVALAYLDPKPDAQGVTGWVMGLVGVLGISSMFLAVGLGWIGYRMWIRGIDGKLARDLGGIVATTFTLAILVGALSPELGGRVGSIGALVTRQLTVFVGLIFGVMVVLLPAWFLWLKPVALAAGELPQSSAPTKARATDSSGVTAAEAEALLPKSAAIGPRPSAAAANRTATQAAPTPAAPTPAAPKTPTPKAPAPASASTDGPESPAKRESALDAALFSTPKVFAPSPYPPDVRREGRVPEGARPLETGSTVTPRSFATPEQPRTTSPAPAAPVHELPHEPLPAQDPRDASPLRSRHDADLDTDVAGAERRRHVEPLVVETVVERDADDEVGSVGAELATHGDRADATAQLAAEPATDAGGPFAEEVQHAPVAELADDSLTYADALAQANSAVAPLERTPPAPTWEQPDMFEEPVDAYGTPLSLVESLRKGEAATDSADAHEAGQDGSLAKAAAHVGSDDADRAAMGAAHVDDEAELDSVRPFTEAAAQDESEPEFDSEFGHEVGHEFGHGDVAATLTSSVESPRETLAAAADSRDELRAELRGWIEGASEATEAAIESGIEEERPAPVEATIVESPVAEAESDESDRQHVDHDAEPTVAELEPPALAAAASLIEPVIEPVIESALQSAPEPAVAAVPPIAAPNEAPVDSQVELSAQASPQVSARISADEPAVTHVEAPVESAKPSSSKPAVKIRSLFGDDESDAAAPSSNSVDGEPTSAVAAGTPIESAETLASAAVVEAHADASLDEVVLEPTKKSKRKAKAAATPAVDEAAPREHAANKHGADAHERTVDAKSDDVAATGGGELHVVGTEDEPDVELTPTKPRARTTVPVDELVFKAGCLFLERQRVAVSMLQREFGLDFDAATTVLDQLQRAGLIGPYLGGQRRDILLTLDEWQSAVSVE